MIFPRGDILDRVVVEGVAGLPGSLDLELCLKPRDFILETGHPGRVLPALRLELPGHREIGNVVRRPGRGVQELKLDVRGSISRRSPRGTANELPIRAGEVVPDIR